jgi:hypothetical protein
LAISLPNIEGLLLSCLFVLVFSSRGDRDTECASRNFQKLVPFGYHGYPVSGTLPANVELAEFEERFRLELVERGTGGV